MIIPIQIVNLFYGERSYYEERFKLIKKYANKHKKDKPELKTEIDKIKGIEKIIL